jgi:DNA-binding sugar fermentation-stimulating protein
MLDHALIDEFDATLALVRRTRDELLERPTVPTARGGDRMNPLAIVLRDQQAHLVRVAKLMTARKIEPPVDMDAELAALLDA